MLAMATKSFSDKAREAENDCDSSETFGSPGSPPPTPTELSSSEMIEEASSNNLQLVSTKHRRKHTPEQKRSMKRERKKRKRQKRAAIRKIKELQKQNEAATGPSRDVMLYKQMARHYWDRWQWELQKHKEAAQLNREKIHTNGLHEIDPALLTNPSKDGQPTEIYLGQGSFSIVQLKVYRGFNVAVKQYRACTEKSDVCNEAMVLSRLCHPYLPYLFGVCTESSPYQLVMQFYGIGLETVTLSKEMLEKKLLVGPTMWLITCSQLTEAISYIHEDIQILHNDIKPDNILLSADPTAADSKYQIILSDFGKATSISHGRQYNVSASEKAQYQRKYPHIAPEVVDGKNRQSTSSDIYAVGVLFDKLLDHDCFFSLAASLKNEFALLSAKCKSCNYSSRPSAKQCMEAIKKLVQL